MPCYRLTRPTNGFSKKAENRAAAVALHFAHYNFCRAWYARGDASDGSATVGSHLEA
jgi:hypothetical protein